MKRNSPARSSIRQDPFRQTAPRLLESAGFSDWRELERFLAERFGLKEVSFSLQPDFIGSDSAESPVTMSRTKVARDTVLLASAIGYHVRLCMQLVFGTEVESELGIWPLGFESDRAMGCAKRIYSRQVNDRVVELIANRDRSGVASFYLNEMGEIDSCSVNAEAYIKTRFGGGGSSGTLFPEDLWEYVSGMLGRCRSKGDDSLASGVAFPVFSDHGIENYLLRAMGKAGFLLSVYSSES